MKSWKAKLAGTLLTLILLVSLISLVAIPATASPGNVLYFDPDPAEVIGCGESVDVKIMAESDVPLISTLLVFEFDPTCLQITNTVGNTADWFAVTFSTVPDPNVTGEIMISSTVGLSAPVPVGTVEIATLTLECVNCEGCTSTLDFTQGEYTDNMYSTIYPDLDDGTFTCGAPAEKTLVSGLSGAVPKDYFTPGEDVYVWGSGYRPDMDYTIYIEPYVEGVAVAEGDTLNPNGGDPVGYTPVTVPAAGDGTIGPVYLFTAAEEHICNYMEIVADDIGGASPGVYNAAEDGLDAVALDEYGFHIVPEALTIILLGAGLAIIGSYVVIRKRKSVHIEA